MINAEKYAKENTKTLSEMIGRMSCLQCPIYNECCGNATLKGCYAKIKKWLESEVTEK